MRRPRIATNRWTLDLYGSESTRNYHIIHYLENPDGTYTTYYDTRVSKTGWDVNNKFAGYTPSYYGTSPDFNESKPIPSSGSISYNGYYLYVFNTLNDYSLTRVHVYPDYADVKQQEEIDSNKRKYNELLSNYTPAYTDADRPANAPNYLEFKGWFEDPTGQTPLASDATMPFNDHAIYAVWEPKEFKVTFELNGGHAPEGDNSIYGEQTVKGGKTADRPADPVRDAENDASFTFIGWKDENGKDFSFDTTITKDIVVYAAWNSPDWITIEYDAGKFGTVKEDIDQNRYSPVGRARVYADAIPNDDSQYVFLGWWIVGDGETVLNPEEDGWSADVDYSDRLYASGRMFDINLGSIEWDIPETDPEHKTGWHGTLTLKAIYGKPAEIPPITVSFVSDYPDGSTDDKGKELDEEKYSNDKVVENQDYYIPDPTTDNRFGWTAPVGYSFGGWSYVPNSNQKGDIVFYAGDLVVADTLNRSDEEEGNDESNTLYAVWLPIEGTLKIIKKVIVAGGGEDPKGRTEFQFNVKSEDAIDGPYNENITVSVSEKDGVLTGETTVSNLTYGHYSIEEAEASREGYTTTYETKTVDIEKEGQITEVTVTNTSTPTTLKVTKTAAVEGRGEVGQVYPGETVKYTVTATNTGDYDAVDVDVVDVLSAATPKLGEPKNIDNNGKLDGGKITWSIGSIPKAENVTLTYTVDVPEEQVTERVDWHNNVSASFANQSDSQVTTDLAARATIYELPYADLTIEKTVTGDGAPADASFTFTVTLYENNNGTKGGVATSVNGKHGDVEFTNGEARVTVKTEGFSGSVTIPDLPAGLYYTVEETPVIGYQSESEGASDTVAAGNKASFTNEYQGGSLSVTKTVERGLTADATATFDVTVTLYEDAGHATKSGLTGTYGGMQFEDGVATLTLTPGTPVKAENLPAGLYYAVVEKEETYPDYTVSNSGDTALAIDAETERSVTVTNTRKTGNLTVSKTVKGDYADQDKAFDFTITLDDTGLTGPYTVQTTGKVGGIASNNEIAFSDGKADITLTHDASITIQGLPVGVTYTVSEKNYADDGYATTHTGDDNGKLTTEDATVAYTNERKAAAELTVTKTVTGEGADKHAEETFTIGVTLGDTSITGDFDVTVNDKVTAPTGSSIHFDGGKASVTMKDGGEIAIKNLPAGTTYSVEETAAPGFTTRYTGKTGTLAIGETYTAAVENYVQQENSKTSNGGGSVQVGDEVIYTINWANNNDAQATMTITDKLPEGLQYVSHTGEGGAYNGTDTVTWTFTAEAMTKGFVTVTAKVTAAALKDSAITNTATIGDGIVEQEATVDATDTVEKGNLTVSKTVAGTGKADHADDVFTFTITLDNADITGENGSFSVTTNEKVVSPTDTISFDAGVATVQMKDGGEITITGLPAGVTYTVAETPVEGFDPEHSNDIGSISKDSTVTASFTNYIYQEHGNEKSLETKLPNDVAQVGDELTYKITWANNSNKAVAVTITDTLEDGLTFVEADNNGTADGQVVTWNLGEQGPYTSGAVTVTVQINEKALVNDKVTNKAELKYGETSEVAISEVETDLAKPGSLTVSKIVAGTGAEDDESAFTITVTLKDAGSKPLTGTYAYTKTGDAAPAFNGDGIVTLTLKNDESVTITGLPAGATYEVSEEAPTGYVASFDMSAKGEITADGEAKTTVTNYIEQGENKKTAEVPNAAIGEDVTYTIHWVNNNTTGGTVTITDTLHNGLTFKSATPEGTYSVSGQTVTWTITAEPYESGDVTVTATVNEEAWTLDPITNTATVNDGHNPEVTVTSDSVTIDTGSLTISKTVDSKVSGDDQIEFEFEITLSDTLINETYSDVKFVGGVAKVTLKAGQSKTIEGLPAGVTYTVQETGGKFGEADVELKEFTTTVTGAADSASDTATGKITKDVKAEAAFTNTRKTIGSGAVKVEKTASVKRENSAKNADGKLEVVEGDVVTYTITVKNEDPDGNIAKNVTVVDAIPAGMTLVEGSIASNPEGITSKTEANSTITWGPFDLEAGKSVEVSFNVTVPALTGEEPKEWQNVATASFDNKKDEDEDPEGEADIVQVAPKLTLEKTVTSVNGDTAEKDGKGQFPVTSGDVVEYSITVTNTGTGKAVNVIVSDKLPEGLKLVEDAAAITGEGKYDEATNTITWTIAELEADAEKPAKVTYKVTVPDVKESKTWTNTAEAKFDNSPAGHEALTSSAVIIAHPYWLTIHKRVDGTAAELDREFEFTVSLTYNGNPLQGTYGCYYLFNADNPPSKPLDKVSFNEKGEATVTLKANQRITIEGLPDGTQFTVTEADYSDIGYATTANGVEGRTVSGKITSDETLDDSINRVLASFLNTRSAATGLTITKLVDEEEFKEVFAGDKITYSITAKNDGDVDAYGVVVTDELPKTKPELTIGEISEGGKLSEDGTSIVWDIGTLAAGTSKTMTVEATVPAVEKLTPWTNTAVMTYENWEQVAPQASRAAGDGGQLSAEAEIYEGVTGLTVTKVLTNTGSAKNGAFAPNETAKFEIVVKNTGSATLMGVVVTEKLEGAEIVPGSGYTVNDDGTATIESIDKGKTVTVYAQYTVTEEDVKSKKELVNIASASSKPTNRDSSSDPVTSEDTARIPTGYPNLDYVADTGDRSVKPLWIMLMTLAALGMAATGMGCWIYVRRKSKRSR